ncbi:MAG TPA: LysR family transcriptional regulator [Candidatus Mediterraneibacter intestinigallinarum]|nr:LysR family transcriptional regulator [Candidatus Mediterraneibacter intestinigallinarum]
MTLTQLRYVIAIAETKSINKAAEQLYVSQPSLTSAVQELEKELGIILFNRSGRGVTLTNDGAEFLLYARQLYGQYETLLEKYGENGSLKKKFGVSTQHYSFAVKAFVDMAKQFDMSKYEFAIRETKTAEVISDVSTMKSEIGVLYLSDFNRKSMEKLLRSAGLEFHHLIDCQAYVYLWKNHPLAKEESISFSQLFDYPCLAFEQGDNSSFYLAEEILSTNEYPRIIRANDRATMLNLMVGLNGYTLCSGIICEELNGNEFTAVPFRDDEENHNSVMEIGYVVRKNTMPGKVGEMYIGALKKYLGIIDN